MTVSLFLSMALFALASSITPGPVNIVALGAGVRYGFRASLPHVTGATLGFTVLLLLIGLGLSRLMEQVPQIVALIQWGGVAFLLFMACQLALDSGAVDADPAEKGPSLWGGALMQWLNPKAWMASLAGTALYTADGHAGLIWQFATIYFLICYGSIAVWACAGTFMRRFFQEAGRMRAFYLLMAALLAVSALYLVWG